MQGLVQEDATPFWMVASKKYSGAPSGGGLVPPCGYQGRGATLFHYQKVLTESSLDNLGVIHLVHRIICNCCTLPLWRGIALCAWIVGCYSIIRLEHTKCQQIPHQKISSRLYTG